MAGETQTLQALNTYLDGKIKRYNLMFAVNGGIFALAKLISVPAESNPLGRLKLIHLSIGAIAFTFIMWFDIWLWGALMRKEFLKKEDMFSWRGKVILSSLASLLIIGWLLAVASWFTTLIVFGLLGCLGTVLLYLHSKAKNKTDDNATGKTASNISHA